jgi:PilZ domain-containing protein
VAIVRRLDGRMEKRLPIAILVRLTQPEERSPSAVELTYTNNVSAHGACVISHRPWRLDQRVEVTTLEDEVPLRGKVVHCHKHSDNQYAVGLAFNGNQVTWSRYCRYACT